MPWKFQPILLCEDCICLTRGKWTQQGLLYILHHFSLVIHIFVNVFLHMYVHLVCIPILPYRYFQIKFFWLCLQQCVSCNEVFICDYLIHSWLNFNTENILCKLMNEKLNLCRDEYSCSLLKMANCNWWQIKRPRKLCITLMYSMESC
jgi:hypothetical protein